MFSQTLAVKTEIKIIIDKEVAQTIINALIPETENLVSDRSRIQIRLCNEGIKLIIQSEDIVALRSAVNTYLYWINGIINITNKIKKID